MRCRRSNGSPSPHSMYLPSRRARMLPPRFHLQERQAGCFSAPVNINDLPTHEFDNISWDSKAGMIRMQREQRIGTLVVDSKPLQDADKQQIIHILCTAIRKEGLSMLDWNEDVQRLQRRVAKVREWHPEMELPDLSTAHLMETAAEWLPFYLEQGGKLKTSTAELRKLNLPETPLGTDSIRTAAGNRPPRTHPHRGSIGQSYPHRLSPGSRGSHPQCPSAGMLRNDSYASGR